MSEQETVARVWEIIETVGVGMFTTHRGASLRARPLEARPDRPAAMIYFVTDVRGGKDDEIADDAHVGFVMIDSKSNAYLSITGTARVTRDPARAKSIWHKTDDVWWPGGPDDPNVRVIALTPVLAELWDGPSSMIVVTYEFAKARITGEKPKLGENRKSTAHLR